ncbi:LapA family protein [Streptomyces sp. HC44]|uniref:LapA family protein n=1 Tax=Streptomyces scabichelini TaxID=2711217 RepID=A0A6G4V748_9ACTN|nr:LapA family protein [Streptomyces scabichelini]NGO09670.1 LapA family protein [Streptomyces scabichelini]
MTRKTSASRIDGGRKSAAKDLLTPGRIAVAVLAVLALIFVFQNTGDTEIRLIVPEVTMPLWLSLLGTMVIGALCGAYFMGRRR